MDLNKMDIVADTATETIRAAQPGEYQPSFDTANVQGSGFGLSVISSFFRNVFQVVLLAALAYGSYWFVSKYILQSVEVVGISMLPTLHNSDHYLLDRWTYLIRDPQPNDIIVLRDPEDDHYSVKRIVACSGDSLLIKEGQVFLNGRKLDEPYLATGTTTYSNQTRKGEQWVVCGKDQYFVMGDNRENSEDSRAYGPLPRKNIVGTVMR
jgi:signal peptidase I